MTTRPEYNLFEIIADFIPEGHCLHQKDGMALSLLTDIPFSRYLPLAIPSLGADTDPKAVFTQARARELSFFLEKQIKISFPQTADPKTSFVIVLHNRAELTLTCLLSILKTAGNNYEIIIVDNNSSDRTHLLLDKIEGVHIIKNQENLHFLKACNQAVERAQGEYLVFLNNDAILTPHTLQNAVEVFECYKSKKVGALGGKIVLLDGTLQEAGSIIWNDGSCLGYERNQSPLQANTVFRRYVDYCSAAFLLTPRRLFEELGAFDEAYSPAYYEETDYALRLRKAGYKILYEPSVVVRHFEFASSEQSEKAINLQKAHQSIFVDRHKDVLEEQSAPGKKQILEARIPSNCRETRVLFIDDQIPHVDMGSGFPRANKIVNLMTGMGYQVTIYSASFPYENEWDANYRDLYGTVEIAPVAGKRKFSTFWETHKDYFDLVWVSRPHNMDALYSTLKRQPGSFKLIYDAEAIFSLRTQLQKKVLDKKYSKRRLQKALENELALANHAHRVVTVTKEEAEVFRKRGSEVYTLDISFALHPSVNSFNDREGLVFVGNMNGPESPNVDSILWFVHEVYPILQQKTGDVPVFFIGRSDAPNLSTLKENPLFHWLGVQEDLLPWMEKCRVALAPTRFSAGSPAKVFQYAAYGVPVMASDLIAKQSGLPEGEGIISAGVEDAGIFADRLAHLYSDEQLWKNVREHAIQYLREEKNESVFQRQLTKVLHFEDLPLPEKSLHTKKMQKPLEDIALNAVDLLKQRAYMLDRYEEELKLNKEKIRCLEDRIRKLNKKKRKKWF
jgi:GT2 family glycosyltransferase/glycosyltransferase involved in cell wall biosynthesis